MPFNKFVPAYHHHFGYQCKVSEYGFTKLIELFEAIPDTVRVEDLPDGERKISLTIPKALNLLGSQIADLIRKSELSYLPLESLQSAFKREYSYQLKPHYYECADVNELIEKLNDHIRVTHSRAGPLLVLVEMNLQSMLERRVWALLIKPPHYLKVSSLISQYTIKYNCNITVQMLEQLNNVIINKQNGSTTEDTIIFLAPHYATAAKIYLLLYKSRGQLPYKSLESTYANAYGVPLFQEHEDAHEMLFNKFNFLLLMRRTRRETYIELNPKIAEYGLPLGKTSDDSVSTGPPSPNVMVEESVFWQPPATSVNAIGGSRRAIAAPQPPKPDTPPAAGSAPWRLWDSPRGNFNMEISIPMPLNDPPMNAALLEELESMISPYKNMLCVEGNARVPTNFITEYLHEF